MTKPNDLTSQQSRVLLGVQDSIRETGYPPSVRERGATGSEVDGHVHTHLEPRTQRVSYESRPKIKGVTVVSPAPGAPGNKPHGPVVMVPLVGAVRAGTPT
jgi:SOS-response transcriptional repressor LexA